MGKENLPVADVTTRTGVQADLSPLALQRWSPDVRAAGETDTSATISILDRIGADFWDDGVTAKRISAALRAIGDKPVTVNINSPGGDFFEGLAIYNLLRQHTQEVTVNVLAMAASAASVIAMAGDTVQIAKRGFLMIHNTRIGAAGDRHVLHEVADWLQPFDEMSVEIYAARTGKPADELAKMLDRETWITGQSAVDQGFADDFLPADMVEADASEASAGLRAEKKFDLIAAQSGLTSSARRQLLQDLKGGKPGAAPTGMPGAADIEQDLQGLLTDLKNFGKLET